MGRLLKGVVKETLLKPRTAAKGDKANGTKPNGVRP
jgi:hypothetical protein